MSQQPILLTGATGQVGGYALARLRLLGEVLAPDRSELDLYSEASIRNFVREHRPRWIINPAAYTAVDKAEDDRDNAFASNAEAPRILGEEAHAIGAAVLHFSTDYVFSGDGDKPSIETDLAAPINVYGTSKLAGERALAATGAAHLILRTSWVYGATGRNFLRTILRLARERDELRVVDDQVGSPTSADSLARLVSHIVRQCEDRAFTEAIPLREAVQLVSGVYHAADRGYTSWFGFAQEILRLARVAAPGSPLATIAPTTTEAFPTRAVRPRNSRMDTSKLAQTFGYVMPDWQRSLADIMAEVSDQG